MATLVRGALPANNLVFSFFYLVYFFQSLSLVATLVKAPLPTNCLFFNPFFIFYIHTSGRQCQEVNFKCFCKIVLIHKSSVCGWQRWSDVIFFIGQVSGIDVMAADLTPPLISGELPVANINQSMHHHHTPSYSRAKNANSESEK